MFIFLSIHPYLSLYLRLNPPKYNLLHDDFPPFATDLFLMEVFLDITLYKIPRNNVQVPIYGVFQPSNTPCIYLSTCLSKSPTADTYTLVLLRYLWPTLTKSKKKNVSDEGHDVSQFKTTSGHEQTEDTYPIPGVV